MTVKCSVVVPVWNPGPNLAHCVDSLLAQTMPADDYEIILVDDGSTDGTADRLDELAAEHPDLIRVTHLPGSGWPGAPRNVGIGLARGDYLHFVDNDDMLPPYALEAMYDAALDTAADVVLGRPASDFRGLDHRIYRQTLRGTTLAEFPALVGTLTPHKLFRRAMLTEYDVRFLEGAPLEDQPFVMRAYLQARSITVLADRCYYYYLRRLGSGRNAGDAPVDTAAHFAALERVLDVVQDAADSGLVDRQLRDTLLRRSYRISLLNPLYSAGMVQAPPERQQEMFEAIRRLVTTRFGPGVRDGGAAVHRILGRLVEAGDLGAVLGFAARYRAITPRVTATVEARRDGTLVLTLDGGLYHDGEPLRCERIGAQGDGPWSLPRWLAPDVADEDRVVRGFGAATPGSTSPSGGALPSDDLQDDADVELVLVSRADAVTYGLGDGVHLVIDDDGAVRISGMVTIDPGAAQAGSPLAARMWDARLQVRFAGLGRSCAVTVGEAEDLLPAIDAGGRVVQPFAAGRRRALGLDVGQWRTGLAAGLASRCVLDIRSRRELRLTVAAAVAAPTEVLVMLEPVDDTDGGLRVCTGTLLGQAETTATATLQLPRSAPDGRWRAWLQLADSLATPPAALPWRLDRSRGRWSVAPSDDAD